METQIKGVECHYLTTLFQHDCLFKKENVNCNELIDVLKYAHAQVLNQSMRLD